MPGGWTPAPRAAAERSARNLLTGPNKEPLIRRAAAGGQAGGGIPPLPCRRVYRALITRSRAGAGAAGRDAQRPFCLDGPRARPSPEPGRADAAANC